MSPEELFRLGLKYDLGKGVRQDFNKARQYYEQAISYGYPKAFNNLGTLYEQGDGVDQDYKKAKEYYEKASNNGNTIAKFNLGELYYNGFGVDRNWDIAEYYFKIAAEQGHSKSRQRLIEINNNKLNSLMEESKFNPIVNKRFDIIKDILNRKIKFLIHFTHIDNLENIIDLGFIPKKILDDQSTPYKYNDEQRDEGRLDCTCFSIEFPNEWMMRRYRNKWRLKELEDKKELNERICVIRLNMMEIVKNHKGAIYFTQYNSASGNIKNELSSTPENFSTHESFKKMFLEKNPDTRFPYTRQEKNLPDFLPTHHQAEVLITDIISIDYIDTIYFFTEESYNYFVKNIKSPDLLSKFKFKIDNFYFGTRDNIKWEIR